MVKRTRVRSDRWRWALAGLGVVGLGLAVWQFARAGFDWRAVLAGTDPWMFFLAMASLPVFGFPISVCYVYAGMAFGLWTAVLVCWSALAINMTASYWLTRTIFKEPLARLLAKRGWKIPEVKGENMFRLTFILRTVPGPPFFFQNLILGLAGIPFVTYLWVSLMSQGLIAAGVIYCVGTLSRDPGSVGGIVAMVVVGALVVVKFVKWLGKRRAASTNESGGVAS